MQTHRFRQQAADSGIVPDSSGCCLFPDLGNVIEDSFVDVAASGRRDDGPNVDALGPEIDDELTRTGVPSVSNVSTIALLARRPPTDSAELES